MNERNNGRGIFYGVIGVATLVVAIIGATFAYFTATATDGQNEITGNMATITFGVSVEKVVDPGATSGMIPMSNTMVETAVNDTTGTTNATCVDDNGNAVCQVYKITVTNTSSATMFVDGYVALSGGSGTPTDYPDSYLVTNDNGTADNEADDFKEIDEYDETDNDDGVVKNVTTMRWAQVFKIGAGADGSSHYTTAGTQNLGTGTGESVTFSTGLGSTTDETGKNMANIKTLSTDVIKLKSATDAVSIDGNKYDSVTTNYIRLSNHASTAIADNSLLTRTLDTSFNRTDDITSMLVLSQQLQPKDAADGGDEVVYYFVVWLSETGTNQTADPESPADGADNADRPNGRNNFFNGIVTFNSAQGSEVTATFTGYTAVPSDNAS